MSLNLHQSFLEEFSEHKEKIENLLEVDPEFKSLLEQYRELDETVMKVEQEVLPLNDIEAEKLKKQRLQLKDKLFAKLQPSK